MKIILKNIHIENFKGVTSKDFCFSNKTNISGRNATGKTTIFDAVTWLLFNKNSLGVEKFEIRPLDENGKPIDFVEILVRATFEKDGLEFSLEKKQKQKWVKHTGNETAAFEGNVNEFCVNGFPKSEKDYKAFIAEMISEDLFKLLSNPAYFAGLKWKEQRDILMKFASNVTDLEFAKSAGGYEELIPELEKAPSTNDIKTKWLKSKKELDALQKELPTRIDEVTKQKVDYDVAELELAKTDLEHKMASAKGTNNNEILNDLRKQSMDIDLEISSLKVDREKSIKNMRSEAERRKADAENNIKIANSTIDYKARAIAVLDDNIRLNEEQNEKNGKEYYALADATFDESAWIFDENSTICSMCGQKLPEEKISELKTEFESRKATAKEKFETDKKSKMESLVNLGKVAKEIIANSMGKKSLLENDISVAKASVEQNQKIVDMATSELANMPLSVDLSNDAEFLALTQKSSEIKAKIAEIESLVSSATVNTSTYACELDIVNQKLAAAMNNDKIDDRIAELKAEQREVSQKIADCEKMLYLLETFTRAKLDAISASINDKFETIKFKLFNVLLNGGIEETCEITINGVPYSSANSGARIVAGLEVINTLGEFYDKSVFTFVDNAETINESNLPAMNNQLIRLSVTEDNELKVESEG